MSWTFIVGLIIAVIAAIMVLFNLKYDVANNVSGQITSSQQSRVKLVIGFIVWIGICFLIDHFGLRSLGTILLWIANIPVLVFASFVLIVTLWGPKDFK